jgi:hypothetical protein
MPDFEGRTCSRSRTACCRRCSVRWPRTDPCWRRASPSRSSPRRGPAWSSRAAWRTARAWSSACCCQTPSPGRCPYPCWLRCSGRTPARSSRRRGRLLSGMRSLEMARFLPPCGGRKHWLRRDLDGSSLDALTPAPAVQRRCRETAALLGLAMGKCRLLAAFLGDRASIRRHGDEAGTAYAQDL